jgi:hypothetical protein
MNFLLSLRSTPQGNDQWLSRQAAKDAVSIDGHDSAREAEPRPGRWLYREAEQRELA